MGTLLAHHAKNQKQCTPHFFTRHFTRPQATTLCPVFILQHPLSHMLLGRGRHTLNHRDAIQIWQTGINAIKMDIGEDIVKFEVLGKPAPCLGEEV